MRAVEIAFAGGPEALTVVSRPVPVPAAGQVLIKVAAAGVNRHDLRQRSVGSHSLRAGESDLPGMEVAGEVAAVGTGVQQWAAGDRVVALLRGGGYAEYAVATAGHCLPLPAGCDWVQGASLPEAMFTAWSNLVETASLGVGERVLIHGGSSGVGVAAIQLAVARGAEVYATAGSAAKCNLCRDLGASVAINYREEVFEDVVLAQTSGRGADVVLDMVGGSYIARDIACLASGGRLLAIAAAAGQPATVAFEAVIGKQLSLYGTLLRERPDEYKTAIRDDLLAEVWPLLESAAVRPVVDSVYPLARADEAHSRMEAGGHLGKIVLDVGAIAGQEPGTAGDEPGFDDWMSAGGLPDG